MAEFKYSSSKKDGEKKDYATDDAGMMADAKEYAKRDVSTAIALCGKLGFDTEDDTKVELIVKQLIAVKFEQIKKSRTERPAYMKFLED